MKYEFCSTFNFTLFILNQYLFQVKNQHKYGGKSAIGIYGLTKCPNDNDYMIVMQYAKGGDLHKYLQKRFTEITWTQKIEILCEISEGYL